MFHATGGQSTWPKYLPENLPENLPEKTSHQKVTIKKIKLDFGKILGKIFWPCELTSCLLEFWLGSKIKHGTRSGKVCRDARHLKKCYLMNLKKKDYSERCLNASFCHDHGQPKSNPCIAKYLLPSRLAMRVGLWETTQPMPSPPPIDSVTEMVILR